MSAGLEALLRWMHVLVGILWIGHLYFFNFVNGPTAAKLDGPTKKAVVPELMPRALYWFRWGAAWTWITGVLLLMMVFYMGKQTTNSQDLGGGALLMIAVTFLGVVVYDLLWKSPLADNAQAAIGVSFGLIAVVVILFVFVGDFTYRAVLIHTGAMFGTIMAYNVWMRIWPAQQKIIRAIKDGQAPDGALVKLAGLRSKHNTYLSLPLFWAMINQHTTFFAGGNVGLSSKTAWIGWLIIIIIGWAIINFCYKKAAKVEGF